jgi:regulator of sigma E protease
MAVVYFVVLVGVLIFVHELGHFAWAKFFGVRVLRFSLGFGPKIAGVKRGETEYVIAAFPLGGYVRMLGESPADVVAPEDRGRSFPEQPLWKRIVIVFAGPLMNLVFPVVLYFVVFLGDREMTPPVVGTVLPDRPADGRLQPGDRILSIDGRDVSTWYELGRLIEPNAGRPLEFVVDREGRRTTVRITPALTEEQRPLDLTQSVGRVGIMPNHPLAVIGIVSPSQPAAVAGLRTFDRVIAAAGRPIERWIDLERVLDRNRGSMLPLTYLRPVRLVDALHALSDLQLYEPHVAILTPEGGPGSGAERTGIESSDLFVARVAAGSPEHRAGLRPGDRLVALDGRPIRLWATFLEDLRAGGGAEHELTWRRGDQLITRRLRLAHERVVDEYGQAYDRYSVGIQHWAPTTVDPPVPNPAPLTYAAREALRATWEMIELTATSIVRLLQGRLSVRTIGGPLMIFEVAGSAAREGTLNYLSLMAFISINLGLLNLLPIPLLDGGHLLFLTIEGVSRRPVSRRVREIASLAGLLMLLLVMVLAFTNDIERQWPEIVAAFESAE